MKTGAEMTATYAMVLFVFCLLAMIWFPQYIGQLSLTAIVLLLTALGLKGWALAKKEGRIK